MRRLKLGWIVAFVRIERAANVINQTLFLMNLNVSAKRHSALKHPLLSRIIYRVPQARVQCAFQVQNGRSYTRSKSLDYRRPFILLSSSLLTFPYFIFFIHPRQLAHARSFAFHQLSFFDFPRSTSVAKRA